jgi:hypothetical protein
MFDDQKGGLLKKAQKLGLRGQRFVGKIHNAGLSSAHAKAIRGPIGIGQNAH